MRELKFKFWNRPIPMFPVNKWNIRSKERKFLKVEAALLDDISGLGIIKLFAHDTYDTLTMKIKYEINVIGWLSYGKF